MYDWLIVGAGFTGATLAERLAAHNQKVLVIDQRAHVGGNAYDEVNEAGLRIHHYGPHIFHTNSEKVWTYLSRFTQWRPYAHHVLGLIKGQLVPIPFNLNTLDALFEPSEAERFSSQLIRVFGLGAKVPILKLRESDDPDLRFIGDYIYENVFLHYTLKQWGISPEELDPSVTSRVPVVISRDDRYFQDTYQSMPQDGYAKMFEAMLESPNITVELNKSFSSLSQETAKRCVFTGAIDEFFEFKFGELPYRSLRFDVHTEPYEQFQSVGTVNYPNDFDYTRVTEMKHLTGDIADVTTVMYEYPEAYHRGNNIPYYPIPSLSTKQLLQPYLDQAQQLKGCVWFAGRLGDYQYYNMDQACARALSLFEKELAPLISGKGLLNRECTQDI